MPSTGSYPGLAGAVIIYATVALSLSVFLLAALWAVLAFMWKRPRGERFGRVFLRFTGGPLAALVLSGSALLWAYVVMGGNEIDEASVPVFVLTVAVGIAFAFLFRRAFPPQKEEPAGPSGRGPTPSDGGGHPPRLWRERR